PYEHAVARLRMTGVAGPNRGVMAARREQGCRRKKRPAALGVVDRAVAERMRRAPRLGRLTAPDDRLRSRPHERMVRARRERLPIEARERRPRARGGIVEGAVVQVARAAVAAIAPAEDEHAVARPNGAMISARLGRAVAQDLP